MGKSTGSVDNWADEFRAYIASEHQVPANQVQVIFACQRYGVAKIWPARVAPESHSAHQLGVRPRERRESRRRATRGGDSGDDPEPADELWALTFVDRAPFFWRLRAARCRYREWREGVDR